MNLFAEQRRGDHHVCAIRHHYLMPRDSPQKLIQTFAGNRDVAIAGRHCRCECLSIRTESEKSSTTRTSMQLKVKKERSVVRDIRTTQMPNLFVRRELAREHECAGAAKSFAYRLDRRVERSRKNN